MIDQLSVFIENKAGRLAELTRTLSGAQVNMRALILADTAEFGVVRIICDRPHEAKRALEAEGFGVSLTQVIAVQVPDTPGGLADVLEVFGAEGINVEYAYCFVEPGSAYAVDIFKVDDERAISVLRDAGLTVIAAEQLYAKD